MRARNRLFSALLIGLIFYSAPEIHASEKAAKLKVAATIFPLSDIVSQIAGVKAEVITILPPGANPHAFELAPKTVQALQGARVVFMIGHGFDNWAGKISENVRGIRILVADNELDLIANPDGATDPHYWLSIRNAKQIARNIADTLAEISPEEEAQYRKNLESYLLILEETDQTMKQLFTQLPAKELVTYHDGWRYFARDYGFEIVGNIESMQGSEPTPGRFRELGKAISRHKIKILFSEPAVSKRTAESIAKDFGLELRELDPFGGSGGKKSFTGLMMANAQAIHTALTNEPR